MTLDLPENSPALDLPWIVTFGPASDDNDEVWEPIVCGPYSRTHALAMANAVVIDEELLAVVEPLQPHVEVSAIKAEIARSKEESELFDEAEGFEGEDDGHDHSDHEDHDHDHDHDQHLYPEPTALPTAAELKAGFAKIASKLSA